MSVLDQYEALSSVSNRPDVRSVLQTIITSASSRFLIPLISLPDCSAPGLPDAFTTDKRERLILILLADVLQCSSSRNGRLDKTSTRVGHAHGCPASQ